MSNEMLHLAAQLLTEREDEGPRWKNIARQEQLAPPGDWHVWLLVTGRGWGKTRAGSEWLAEQARTQRGDYAVIGATYGDTRDVAVEGPSGLLAALADLDVKWNRSLGQLALPNGSRLFAISAEEADRLRGRNLSGAWLDELASFPAAERLWSEALAPAVRVGAHPRIVVTTTPRPSRLLRELLGREDGSVVVTRGSTFDNASNLSSAALAELSARYGGSRIGRQELQGEFLLDVPDALWTVEMIDATRVRAAPTDLMRVVVAIDPAVTNHERSDETGIVVTGKDGRGDLYVLADRTGRYSPSQWAQQAWHAFDEFEADAIVVEVNQGGDLVSDTLRNVRATGRIRTVHASRGKRVRAEPIAVLYEQGRVHHVGSLRALEDQLVTWSPNDPGSPDRLDALVWGLTDLGGASSAMLYLRSTARMCPTCDWPNRQLSLICDKCGTTLRSE